MWSGAGCAAHGGGIRLKNGKYQGPLPIDYDNPDFFQRYTSVLECLRYWSETSGNRT